ncbi:hypothetical protein, partial [Ensifer sp. Root31]|uniref:hypothetical protein n=1 Tax=Ensifer sp. Root31 TaxID=1736512 RepID=UPI000AE36C45
MSVLSSSGNLGEKRFDIIDKVLMIFKANTYAVTDRLLPRRFRFEAGDQLLVVDKAVEEVVPFVG